MDRVHYCSGSAPLCRTPGARWCTILRDAVTCPACLAALVERDAAARPRALGAGAARARPGETEGSSSAPDSREARPPR